jgi:hypothetical protein
MPVLIAMRIGKESVATSTDRQTENNALSRAGRRQQLVSSLVCERKKEERCDATNFAAHQTQGWQQHACARCGLATARSAHESIGSTVVRRKCPHLS